MSMNTIKKEMVIRKYVCKKGLMFGITFELIVKIILILL